VFCEAGAGCGFDSFGTELAIFLRVRPWRIGFTRHRATRFLGNLNADG